MRAVVVRDFGPVDAHNVEEFPDPVPGPGQVLIDVEAVGLNFSDRLIMQGKYQVRPDRPFVPDRDAAGVVTVVGDEVTRCAPGDRFLAVVTQGAYVDPFISEAPGRVASAFGEIFAMYKDGEIRPEIMAVRPLDEFSSALGLFDARGMHGKIVLATSG